MTFKARFSAAIAAFFAMQQPVIAEWVMAILGAPFRSLAETLLMLVLAVSGAIVAFVAKSEKL